MRLATSISPHLPYLRRFSRALTGTQQAGDAYVAAVLEALIADPTNIDAKSDVRVALYRMFCRMWESISLNLKPSSGDPELPANAPQWAALAERRLSTMPPRAREAFLLMAVEGFSKSDIAIILGRDETAVSALIDEATKTIVDQVATNVMIIEDEPIIAMDIEAIVETLGHKVTGVARTHHQALQLAAQKRPSLILADIQLADGSSGVDAVNQILASFEVPVIFITAFPERLLTGERPEPAFLITKPFTPEMVKAVISQALFFDTKAQAAA
ncbi:MAG: response regulator [Rhizobiales bacterium]|nr:response regulator [Hyphomicrobiales bacterium]